MLLKAIIYKTTVIVLYKKEHKMTKYIAYRRTSTGSQNNGLEAQQNAINAFIDTHGGEITDSYVEQVSGRKNEREELNKAIKACKKHGATLLVSKLDRLSRRVSFIALLMESSISLKVCEHPDADTFMLHLRAILSEEEARLISTRTKQALAVKKAQGVKLGSPLNKVRAKEAVKFAEETLPIIEELKSQGYKSLNSIASKLNEIGYQTFTGGKWYPTTVKNTLGYLA